MTDMILMLLATMALACILGASTSDPSMGSRGVGHLRHTGPFNRLRGGAGDPSLRTSLVDVAYCTSCGLPGEYCEFVKCKEALDSSPTASRTEAQHGSEKNASKITSEGPLAHGKAHSSSSIKIKVSNRRRNKFVTTVSGLESELPASVTLKDMCKVISNKFAVGASVIKSEDGKSDLISVQGEVSEKLRDLIASKLKIPLGQIKIVE